MGVFDLFRKSGPKTAPKRVCVIEAPQQQVYDEVAKGLAASAEIDDEFRTRIKSALIPFAKMGVKIDDVLKTIAVNIDTSRRPNVFSVSTQVSGQTMGPSTAVTCEAITPTSTRVSVEINVNVDSGGGMIDRLLIAGTKKKMETGADEYVDEMLKAAAETLKAKITFEDPAKA